MAKHGGRGGSHSCLLIELGPICNSMTASLFCFCLSGAQRRINPCGSLASDGIKINMIWMGKVRKM